MITIKQVLLMVNRNANQEKVARLEPVLKKCSEEIESILGYPVFVSYQIKVSKTNFEVLKSAVCEVCQVQWHDVIGRNRTQPLPVARQLFAYFANINFGYKLTTIATYMEQDHTTVIYGRNKINAFLYVRDSTIVGYVNRINEILIAHTPKEAVA